MKIVTSIEEQNRILQACHSDATSGHFGVAKTYKRFTERFYWRGITHQVRELRSKWDASYNCDWLCIKGSYSISDCTYRKPHYLICEYGTILKFGQSTPVYP